MTRCMKARRSSAVACGCYVLRGQLIVNRGGGWVCLACALTAIKTSAAEVAAAAQKARHDRNHDRPDSLLVDVFGSEYTNTDLPVRDWRHSDGRPITAAEAVQMALAPLAEFVEAARWIGLRAEISAARSKDVLRLAEPHQALRNGDPDVTIGDALDMMTPAERAEAEAILARLNGDPRDYLNLP